MATNIIMHQKDGVASDIINDSFVRLLKYRIKKISEGYNKVNFYCLTKDATGLLPEIIQIPIREDENVVNEDWYILQLLDNQPQLAIDHCKNILWNPRLMPLDLCQTAMLFGMPMKGTTDNLPEGHGLDIETRQTIEDNALPFMETPTKWWDDGKDNTFLAHWYMAWCGDDLRQLQNHSEDTNGSVWEYIENNFKGVVLPTKIAQMSPYYLNDKEKNVDLNAQYEEKVRPHFPAEFYPPQVEEMDAELYSYDHEWRDVTPQVRFVYLDDQGDSTIDPKSDMYARLWFL